MKLLWKKYSNVIYLLLSVGSLLLYLLAYHDMQTAEGVGLYFAIRMHKENRFPFDIAADLMRIGCTVLLLVLPGLLMKRRGIASFWRLLSAWTALMPVVSMAELIPLIDRTKGNLWTVSLEESGLLERLWGGETELVKLMVVWFPMLLVLMMGIAMTGQSVILKWYKIILAIVAVLLAGLFVFPGLFVVLQFMILYLILVVAFDLWERLFICYPQMRRFSLCLFGLLWFRGIYRLLELMSISHIG